MVFLTAGKNFRSDNSDLLYIDFMQRERIVDRMESRERTANTCQAMLDKHDYDSGKLPD
jgi:hypothetical protein